MLISSHFVTLTRRHPFHIRHDRDPLPAREMFHSDLEVLPHGTRIKPCEIRSGFIVEPHLPVAFERVDEGRNHNRIVIRLRYAALADEGENIVGKILQSLDYGRFSILRFADINSLIMQRTGLSPRLCHNSSPVLHPVSPLTSSPPGEQGRNPLMRQEQRTFALKAATKLPEPCSRTLSV